MVMKLRLCAFAGAVVNSVLNIEAASVRGLAPRIDEIINNNEDLELSLADDNHNIHERRKTKKCGFGCRWYRENHISTVSSTPSPTKSPAMPNLLRSPPAPEPIHCGCSDCTEKIWNTLACYGSDCHTCGNRIMFKQSHAGGSLSESEACVFVSNEFPNGPCGPDCNSNTCAATPNPTGNPTTSPTNKPTEIPSSSPTTKPTPEPSENPTSSPSTISPSMTLSQSPSDPPVPEPIYCGCPECTETILNTKACRGSQCYTCGDRINYMQTPGGGSLSEADACTHVSNEFPDGPCGPVCNPKTCVATTSSPTKAPTPAMPSPTKVPTLTEPYFCGCSECTQAVLDHDACNNNQCFTCGSRISWLQSEDGGSKSEEEACTQVSNEFSNNECGPKCNPTLCNPEYLDEPNETNLIWSDEFDVDGAPDSTKWDYDMGDGCSIGICAWGNGEEQSYTSDSNNVNISNGILRISAKSNSPQPGYTSTRMVSRGNQAFKYGRIRFRATLANCQAPGTWPALWLLPEDWEYGNWPKSGEIDVMEAVGYETDKFHGSVHTEAFHHSIGTQKTGSIDKSKSDWHIFEIDWQDDNIRFAIDSQVYFQFTPDTIGDYTQWPFDKDFYLIMNIAVGGSWGGLGGVDSTAFDGDGQYMEIDWVRVYSS